MAAGMYVHLIIYLVFETGTVFAAARVYALWNNNLKLFLAIFVPSLAPVVTTIVSLLLWRLSICFTNCLPDMLWHFPV